jgi:hypothetical protein
MPSPDDTSSEQHDGGPQQDVNPAREKSARAYEPTPVVREEHGESTLTAVIEQQTAKIPSDVFLFAALSAMGVSLVAELTGRREISRFVGMWAPTLLTMGVYNKVVKLLKPR